MYSYCLPSGYLSYQMSPPAPLWVFHLSHLETNSGGPLLDGLHRILDLKYSALRAPCHDIRVVLWCKRGRPG